MRQWGRARRIFSISCFARILLWYWMCLYISPFSASALDFARTALLLAAYLSPCVSVFLLLQLYWDGSTSLHGQIPAAPSRNLFECRRALPPQTTIIRTQRIANTSLFSSFEQETQPSPSNSLFSSSDVSIRCLARCSIALVERWNGHPVVPLSSRFSRALYLTETTRWPRIDMFIYATFN